MLAQGAGVALEDAFILARRVKDWNESVKTPRDAPPTQTSPPTLALAAGGEGFEGVLSRYDADRLQRCVQQ